MEYRPEADDDSLFLDNAVFTGTTPEDLASDHDRYLWRFRFQKTSRSPGGI
jgi:hypothetical protein